ncbi:DOMON domain-containing protein [Sphingobacterium haloxyli]|uniref:Carbohydrate-binding domain-containing protein n=1 Tax=Sphingobacterium haloxyli TaxID=2100533 RepID=A0A2S9IWX8_9SPHI|nr:hypothetical protein [Sphingobacterium haloxyli]PRD45027.1 hypothetical protein C5745_18505 [Sphingobacterium haloxyli]
MRGILLGILLLIAGLGQSLAQKKQKITVPSLSAIEIDADLGEWDTLTNVADESSWFYQLAQDASNLYVAVRVEDPMLQHVAARNGILLTVQSNTKNRDDIQFLFPYPDSEVKRAMMREDHDSDAVYKAALIDRSRGYFVYGFPTVPNGLLSLNNGYGIQASARMDNGKLYYEALVPKSLLDYITPVATLKLGIHDGLTPLVSSKKKPAVRSGGMYGTYRGRPAPRSKDKPTLTVLLETTFD